MTTAETLLAWLALRPGERVLDVGCGLGWDAAAMSALGADVTGIDPEPHLLDQARLLCPGGTFLPLGLLDFHPETRFDAIFAHAVLHWITPPPAAARRLFELLKPGGRLAASFGAKAKEAANLVNYYLPDMNEYCSILAAAGFDSIAAQRRPEGFVVFAVRPAEV